MNWCTTSSLWYLNGIGSLNLSPVAFLYFAILERHRKTQDSAYWRRWCWIRFGESMDSKTTKVKSKSLQANRQVLWTLKRWHPCNANPSHRQPRNGRGSIQTHGGRWSRTGQYQYLCGLFLNLLGSAQTILRWSQSIGTWPSALFRHGFDHLFLSRRPEESTPGGLPGRIYGRVRRRWSHRWFCVRWAKNYRYQTACGKVEFKVRGFSVNTRGREQLNFEFVKVNVIREVSDPLTDPQEIPVFNPHKITRDVNTKQLETLTKIKRYKWVFDKRVVNTKNYFSYPYQGGNVTRAKCGLGRAGRHKRLTFMRISPSQDSLPRIRSVGQDTLSPALSARTHLALKIVYLQWLTPTCKIDIFWD